MDLWVRSQDRKALISVKQIRISGLDIMCLNGELLGTYETEERALKVLDEIQKLISLDLLNENISYQEADIYLKTAMLDRMARIYEMPKE